MFDRRRDDLPRPTRSPRRSAASPPLPIGSSTETDSTTALDLGPYQETSTETSNDTLGPGGLSTGGTDVQTAWDLSTMTADSSGVQSTISTTETSTLSFDFEQCHRDRDAHLDRHGHLLCIRLCWHDHIDRHPKRNHFVRQRGPHHRRQRFREYLDGRQPFAQPLRD